jgi:hypothetical protein
LILLVNEAYNYWSRWKPIPEAILGKIRDIELTAVQFLAAFSNREAPQARAIELIDGRVRFRERTGGSHAAGSAEMIQQSNASGSSKNLRVHDQFG